LYGSSVRIEGELGVAESFRSIVKDLDVDAESLLAPITGGSVAHQLGRSLESATSWFQRTATNARLNTKDYLHEESKVLVHPKMATEFTEEVTALREAVDRAEARLRRIERNRSDSST